MKRRIIPLIAALLTLCCLSSAAGETFFFISDTHMKSTGESLSASAAALAAVTAHAQGRDTLLLLGDTTDNGLPEEHALACERAAALARNTGARVLLIPGNHDYNARFGPEACAAQYAASMATGTLAPTIHAGDEEAIAWYVRVFMRHASGEMTPEFCAEMLADDQPGCRKWREIETRTVVKDWIFSLLEHCPESVGEIEVEGRK